MVDLCEGGNEPAGSLEAICKTSKNITMQEYTFEGESHFRYLGVIINNNCDVSGCVNDKIQAGNRAYYANLPLFKNQLLSRMTKIKVYKTVVRPVVTFGSETWTFTKKDENSLRSFERKILRRIFGPVSDHQGWRIRSNNELLNLIGGQDVVKFMKAQRLRWLGHVNRMPETRTPIKMLKGRLYNRRRKGRPKLRWVDGVSKDLEIMGVRGWTNMVKDRVKWKAVVKEAKTHSGL
ncbi:hypothetical protein ANN_15641 [Periplaneta americana]|uniref:Uncharacterized protein n=1 Tax=Periplaneta americana TaxID=6978 RepID=A0ABQ8SI29_PERAM|nr:hypothetical protein ANN_15641 [Periplaneta americana]